MYIDNYRLMVHGGAGNIESIDPFHEPLMDALTEGELMLKEGITSVDAVIMCVTILEDHPRLNAGTGSALNEDGGIELEAAIMSGLDRSIGSVAGIDSVKNPIQLAEIIRRDPSIVKLISDGAMQYSVEKGMPLVSPSDLITERQLQSLKNQQMTGSLIIDGSEEEKMGTVGAVAFDRNGNLAAATSTGGLTGKKVGRVGDTSTPGSGTYADRFAAISGTGKGEDYIRAQAAISIARSVGLGIDLDTAVAETLSDLESLGGRGGIISIDHLGGFTSGLVLGTKGLAHGVVTSEIEARVSLDPELIKD